MKALAVLFGLMTVTGQDSAPRPAQETRTLTTEEAKSLERCLKAVADGKISPSFFGSHAFDRYGARSIPHLVVMIQSEGDTREACASALRHLAGRRGVLPKDAERALIEVVKARKQGSLQAAWALASICSLEGTDALLEAVEDPNPLIAQAACMALGMSATDRARQKLAMMEASDERLHPVVRTARKQALDLIAELSSADRRAAVTKLLSRSAPYLYPCRGWAKSPAYVALRKTIEWDLKEILPELRQMVLKRTQEAGPDSDRSPLVNRLLYAIHALGGRMTPEELDVLRDRGFIRKE